MRAGRRSSARRRVCAALAAVLATAVSLGAQEPSISGALTVNGTSTPLRFVYADARPGFFDTASEDVRILMSSEPLTGEDRADDMRLARRGRSNAARVVEVTLNADGQPISGAIYAPVFNGMLSASGMHAFARTQFDRQGASGRLSTSGTHEIGGVTWGYSAEFAVRISRPPTDEERAGSVRGPAGVAASTYLAALLRGDAAAVRAAARTQNSRYAGEAGAARLDQERRDCPADASVVEVRETPGNRAVAVVQGHANGIVIEYEVPLAREGADWKVDR